MSESKAHRRAKKKAAGRSGRTECPLPSGRKLDACTPRSAYEVERSGDPERLRHAVTKLKESKKREKVLIVPDRDLDRAVAAMKDIGIDGIARNIGGTRRRSVRAKKNR